MLKRKRNIDSCQPKEGQECIRLRRNFVRLPLVSKLPDGFAAKPNPLLLPCGGKTGQEDSEPRRAKLGIKFPPQKSALSQRFSPYGLRSPKRFRGNLNAGLTSNLVPKQKPPKAGYHKEVKKQPIDRAEQRKSVMDQKSMTDFLYVSLFKICNGENKPAKKSQ